MRTPDSTSRNLPRQRQRRAWLVLGATLLLAGAVMVSVRPHEAEAAWTVSDLIWESASCGVTETLTVPAGVTGVRILAVGGRGGAAGGQFDGQPGPGGRPAQLQQTFPVTPGQVISMVVGCAGADGSAAPNNTTTPGWTNGGGAGRGSTSAFEGGASGGAGGGATGVCIGTPTCSRGSSSLRLVAGGGGGGGVTNCAAVDESNSTGGDGGWETPIPLGAGFQFGGAAGASSSGAGGSGGHGATSSGEGGTSLDGSGGLGVNVVGGGGGGGLAGGGPGAGASTGCVGGGGGGGGSSFVYGANAGYHLPACDRCDRSGSMVLVQMLLPVTLTLEASPNPSTPADSVDFTVRATNARGPVVDATVELYVDGTLTRSGTTDGFGTQRFTVSFAATGDYLIEVKLRHTYTDDTGGQPSTSLVQRVRSVVGPTITVGPSITIGPSITVGPSITLGPTTTSTPPSGSTTTTSTPPSGSTTTTSTPPSGSTTTTSTPPSGSTTTTADVSATTALPDETTTTMVDPLPTIGNTSTTPRPPAGPSGSTRPPRALPLTGSALSPMLVGGLILLVAGAATLGLQVVGRRGDSA